MADQVQVDRLVEREEGGGVQDDIGEPRPLLRSGAGGPALGGPGEGDHGVVADIAKGLAQLSSPGGGI